MEFIFWATYGGGFVVFFLHQLDRGEKWWSALIESVGWTAIVAAVIIGWAFAYREEQERKRKENKHYTTEF